MIRVNVQRITLNSDTGTTAAVLLQTVREGIAALAAELAAGKGERLRDALDVASRFHRYSLHNQALIRSQCP